MKYGNKGPSVSLAPEEHIVEMFRKRTIFFKFICIWIIRFFLIQFRIEKQINQGNAQLSFTQPHYIFSARCIMECFIINKHGQDSEDSFFLLIGTIRIYYVYKYYKLMVMYNWTKQ